MSIDSWPTRHISVTCTISTLLFSLDRLPLPTLALIGTTFTSSPATVKCSLHRSTILSPQWQHLQYPPSPLPASNYLRSGPLTPHLVRTNWGSVFVMQHNHPKDYVWIRSTIAGLSPEIAVEVCNLLIRPPTQDPYQKLKDALIQHTSASTQRQLQQLLNMEELCDHTPTQFLQNVPVTRGWHQNKQDRTSLFS